MTTDRTDRTAALTARWSTLLDRLAQGPDGWGPHDTDALCEQVRRLVEERDRLRAERTATIRRARDLALRAGWCVECMQEPADMADTACPSCLDGMREDAEDMRRGR